MGDGCPGVSDSQVGTLLDLGGDAGDVVDDGESECGVVLIADDGAGMLGGF